jgi:heat shock protein HslJ
MNKDDMSGNSSKSSKKDNSKKTRNILIVVIVLLAVVLLAVLIPLTFCTRQDLGDVTEPEPGEETDGDVEIVIEDREGIIDRLTEKYIELDVEGIIILIYFDGYKLSEDISAGDRVYVEYEVEETAGRNILVYLKILEKSNDPEDSKTVTHVGYIEKIEEDFIELMVSDKLLMVYIDGYKLPDDLSIGDKVFVEYEVDEIADRNILKNLEILEKSEISEEPTIDLEVYKGPLYEEEDGTCYYEIMAKVTGEPEPDINWSRDDSGGNLGNDRARIILQDKDDVYMLEATASNSGGTAKASIEIKWGCEMPIENNPPEIEEIITTDELYTEKKYPVFVVASDPDGDELSFSWEVSGGKLEEQKSNPTFWTTPESPGIYEIKITVDDGNGDTASKTTKLEVIQKEQPPEPPDQEITGNLWFLEEIILNDDSSTIITEQEKYLLLLDENETFYILADCNYGSGIYVMADDVLTLEIETMTNAICESESLSDEYISYIEEVESYLIEDGKLYLNLKLDSGSLVFSNIEITPF